MIAGSPFPEVVVRLERYVTALTKASEVDRDAITAMFRTRSGEAAAAFLRLVRAGANPVWIAEECLRVRPHRSDRPLKNNPARQAHIKKALARLSARLHQLAADYRTALAQADEIGLSMRRHATFPQHLVEESRFVDSLVMRLSGRGPSDVHHEYIMLADHLRTTTGSFHDHEVCTLLDAVRPRRDGKRWTAGMLEQHRQRDKARGGILQENIWGEIIEDQITRSRSRHNVSK